MIEGCGLCPTVRSGVVAGRWIPDAFDALVRVGGPASPAPRFRRSPPREPTVNVREPLPSAAAGPGAPVLIVNAEPMPGR